MFALSLELGKKFSFLVFYKRISFGGCSSKLASFKFGIGVLEKRMVKIKKKKRNKENKKLKCLLKKIGWKEKKDE